LEYYGNYDDKQGNTFFLEEGMGLAHAME